jgi:hypothetical protein
LRTEKKGIILRLIADSCQIHQIKENEGATDTRDEEEASLANKSIPYESASPGHGWISATLGERPRRISRRHPWALGSESPTNLLYFRTPVSASLCK